MKNVLVLTSTFPRWKRDTTPAFVFYLSRLLAKKNHITVLAPHHANAKRFETVDGLTIQRFRYFFPTRLQRLCYNGGILENLRRNVLAIIQLPFFLIAEFYASVMIFRSQQITLIHAHWIVPQGFIAVFLKKLFGAKLIITAHAGDVFPLRNWFFRTLANYALSNCDLCTVNSRATKKAVLAVTPSVKTAIIPMGVDVSEFSPQKKNIHVKKRYMITSPFILSVGRLVEKKGILYLIRAMPPIIKKIPNAKLLIVGDGPDKRNLQTLVKELQLEAHVVFAGRIPNDELPSLYATADLFVLPSIIARSGDTEGLGVVLLEALASGTSVIGSNVGGIPAIIIDGKTGLLVPQKNPGKLSEVIVTMLSNQKLRSKLASNGKKHVLKHFSWKHVGTSFEKLYQRL